MKLNIGEQLTLEGLGSMESPSPSSLSAGVDKMQSNFQRAGGVIANTVGAADTGRTLEDMAAANEKEWRKYTPEVESYKDIDSVGSLLSYVGNNLALEAPNLAVALAGRVGLAASAVSMFGETVNEQINRGEDVNYTRAAITGGLEGALNLPLNKAFKSTMKTLDNTNLDEVAKKDIARTMLEGIGTDGGVNAVQHVLREYGVEGEFNMDNIDEAIVGGIIVGSPVRLGQGLASKASQAKLSDDASDIAIGEGEVTKADGFLSNSLNFMVGTALRPVRRIKNTQAGQELLGRINEMRLQNDLAKAGWTTELQNIFDKSSVPEPELRKRYAQGDRSTPELQALESVLGDIHQRATSKQGAGLNVGKIANWLPTIIRKEDFDTTQQQSMLGEYTSWYKLQENKEGLVTPEEAKGQIQSYAKKLEVEEDVPMAKMSRVSLDSEGNVVSSGGRVTGDSPLKQGQLENTRTLGFIPQKILNNYAQETSFKEQLMSYAQGAAHRVTYAEQLGGNNERMNQLVAQTNKELGDGGSQKLTSAELDNLYNSMDAYQGTYQQFQNKTSRKASSLLRSATNIVALPLSLLSSLTEPFNLAIKVGNIGAARAFAKSLGTMSRDLLSWTTNGMVAKSEVARQLALTGRAFKDATTALNARIDGDTLSQGQQNFNNAFFHATGQTTINYLVNSMAVHAMEAQAKTDIQILAGNKNTRGYALAKDRLAAIGITEGAAGMYHSRPDLLKDRMPDMVVRFNRDVALKPDALDKPLWQSTGWGAMFSQLRGYPTMFSNTVLPKMVDMIDPRGKSVAETAVSLGQFATSVGGILSVGFLQEATKDEIRGGTLSDEEILVKALQNTLTPIHISYLYDAVTGNVSRVVSPASASIFDRQTGLLRKAVNGEAKLEDLPVISSFGGLL